MRAAGDPILVTGAAGLIGVELVPALRAAGLAVVATTASPGSEVDEPGVDLSSQAAAAALIRRVRPAAVVHLAGGTATERGELYRRNVLTTVQLLEAVAAAVPSADCVVLGSAAEYGAGAGGRLDESAPLRPLTEYGRAKAAQTAVARWLAAARGIRLTILRPFNLASARLPSSAPLGNLRRQLLAAAGGRPAVECGRLDVVRDFVPLATLVEAVRRLLARPAPGQVINVCSGVGLELGSILEAMAGRLGLRPQVVISPELAALPAPASVIGDPSRMRQVLDLVVEPTADSIAEVLLGS